MTKSFRTFLFEANDTATKLVGSWEILNPNLITAENSWLQEVKICEHLLAPDEFCWLLPKNFRTSLPEHLNLKAKNENSIFWNEAAFWFVPEFDGKQRISCTNLVPVAYDDLDD